MILRHPVVAGEPALDERTKMVSTFYSPRSTKVMSVLEETCNESDTPLSRGGEVQGSNFEDNRVQPETVRVCARMRPCQGYGR